MTDNYLDKLEARIQEALDTKTKKATELQSAYKNRGQVFPQMELLEALKSDNREVMAELQRMRKEPAYKSAWEPKSQSVAKQKNAHQYLQPYSTEFGYSM